MATEKTDVAIAGVGAAGGGLMPKAVGFVFKGLRRVVFLKAGRRMAGSAGH